MSGFSAGITGCMWMEAVSVKKKLRIWKYLPWICVDRGFIVWLTVYNYITCIAVTGFDCFSTEWFAMDTGTDFNSKSRIRYYSTTLHIASVSDTYVKDIEYIQCRNVPFLQPEAELMEWKWWTQHKLQPLDRLGGYFIQNTFHGRVTMNIFWNVVTISAKENDVTYYFRTCLKHKMAKWHINNVGYSQPIESLRATV